MTRHVSDAGRESWRPPPNKVRVPPKKALSPRRLPKRILRVSQAAEERRPKPPIKLHRVSMEKTI